MTQKYIAVETEGAVTIVTLMRESVRNAVNEEMLLEIENAFRSPPKGTKCFVLAAQGAHFCAGLDLREHYEKDRSPIEFMTMCQGWHRTFDVMQFSGIPVVAALQGAVVGGGLELRCRDPCPDRRGRHILRLAGRPARDLHGEVRLCASPASLRPRA